MRKSGKRPEYNMTDTLKRQVSDHDREIIRLKNNRRITIPGFDSANWPGREVHGSVSLADSTGPVVVGGGGGGGDGISIAMISCNASSFSSDADDVQFYSGTTTDFETNDSSCFTDAGGSVNILKPGIYFSYFGGRGLASDVILATLASGAGVTAGFPFENADYPLIGFMSIFAAAAGSDQPTVQKDSSMWYFESSQITSGVQVGFGVLAPSGWSAGGEDGVNGFVIRLGDLTGDIGIEAAMYSCFMAMGDNEGDDQLNINATQWTALVGRASLTPFMNLTGIWHMASGAVPQIVFTNGGSADVQAFIYQAWIQSITSSTRAEYSGNSVTVAAGGQETLTWDTHEYGSSIIDLSGPSIVTEDTYAFTMTIGFGAV